MGRHSGMTRLGLSCLPQVFENLLKKPCKKGKHKGKFRKRAGNYRIIYLKENRVVLITIIRIAHKKEAC